MEPNWLQSLFLGLISGFSEFLPVSAEAHRLLFQKMTGIDQQAAIYRFICQAAALLALLLACYPRIAKLRRERKLAQIPPKRRKRQPDGRLLLDIRLLRCGLLSAVLGMIPYISIRDLVPSLWLLAALLTLNGFILFLPDRFPQGNKDSRSMSSMDGLLLGLCSALSAVPGLSGIACAVTYGKLRGADGRYILDMCLLFAIPVIAVMLAINGYFVLTAGVAVTTVLALKCVACAAAAFIGAYYGIILMRFLAYKVGFSGFAYYCWSVALFSFILYLML